MKVHEHQASSPILQKALKASLPYSIPLVHRTQHPNRTKDAHFIATFVPTIDVVPECWAVAYLDRSMRPKTELWLFAAGENPTHLASDQFCANCREAVLSLLDYMSALPIPAMHPDNQFAINLAKQHQVDHPHPGIDGTYVLSRGAYVRHLLCPKVVTLGASHQAVVQICRDVGVIRPEFPGPNDGLNKFKFA